MSEALQRLETAPPFAAARIPEDEFLSMRRENLARWPTGGEVNLDEAAEYHRGLPPHKQLGAVMRKAAAEGRCLTQPRGGFGTLEMQIELMRALEQDGLADVVPTTTDSYTRNEQWLNAQKGIEESTRAGRSLLNGYPMVNYGVRTSRALIESIDRPAIVLSGTAMPRLTSEIGLASGYSGYLGSGIAYTVSYTNSRGAASKAGRARAPSLRPRARGDERVRDVATPERSPAELRVGRRAVFDVRPSGASRRQGTEESLRGNRSPADSLISRASRRRPEDPPVQDVQFADTTTRSWWRPTMSGRGIPRERASSCLSLRTDAASAGARPGLTASAALPRESRRCRT